jgi:hypothetical protein
MRDFYNAYYMAYISAGHAGWRLAVVLLVRGERS